MQKHLHGQILSQNEKKKLENILDALNMKSDKSDIDSKADKKLMIETYSKLQRTIIEVSIVAKRKAEQHEFRMSMSPNSTSDSAQ